jgi:DNA modification methylase
MAALPPGSVQLVVTSPPYPMIEMWDGAFAAQDPAIAEALGREDGWAAFRRMHALLDAVWREVHRVLADGGIACIDIGDATRTVNGAFALYPNHSRILSALVDLGLTPLPAIIWRKQTNAPNKFMGSGMLPAGAYVTYEHEYVLIFRKGGPRRFATAPEKENRRRSAFFWEERNTWFSDVWTDLKGTGQELADADSRARSGAYPFELAWRLIAMYSVYGDTVLDPFLGTGTTSAAAIASMRNSIGFERDAGLAPVVASAFRASIATGRERSARRLLDHRSFVAGRLAKGLPFKHRNPRHDVPVVSAQERGIVLTCPITVRELEGMRFEAEHGELDACAPVGDGTRG